MDRADAALIAAIELYNKPDIRYREEAFAILALNAWELLLKAKLLDEHRNDLRILYQYERRQTQGGSISQRRYIRRNRAGNARTIGIQDAINALEGSGVAVPDAVKSNLDALTEVRDNAVHFLNVGPNLEKLMLEVGTAAVRNFIELGRRWMGHDLSRYHLYLMPIGFFSTPTADGIHASGEEANLLSYIARLIDEDSQAAADDFHVILEIQVGIRRNSSGSAQFGITNDPEAPLIQLSEEDIRKTYPWDYSELGRRLRARYSNFVEGPPYHAIRQSLLGDSRYVHTRYLDPARPSSSSRHFYNPNIVREFDKYYVLK